MKAASLPLIGVTTGHSLSPTNLPLLERRPQAYLAALRQAGALPVLLPLELEPPALDALLDQLDGLLLTGGGDIHPRRYGGPLHPAVNSVDEARDASELYLAQAATQRGVPLLGICRGLQVLNVALGGSLYEDLSDQRPGSQRHAFHGEFPRDYEAHPVQIEPGSRLAEILGQSSLQVNSLHHQGIRDLAPGLRGDCPCSGWRDRSRRIAGAPPSGWRCSGTRNGCRRTW